MKFRDFKKKYQNYPVIQTRHIAMQEPNMPYLRRLLSEWKQKHWITELKKGVYMINEPYHREKITAFFLANILYEPSYISLESALSYYNMIPEGVFSTTSITPKKTQTYQNQFGIFTYQSIKKENFFGFTQTQIQKQNVFIATREKALLDFLYYHTAEYPDKIRNKYRLQNLKELDPNKLQEYAEKFNKPILKNMINTLLKQSQEETSFQVL